MVDAGTTITSPGSFDFYGDALYSGAPDIGADEYVVSAGGPRENERAAMLGIDGIYRMILPAPDGVIGAEDRAQLACKYIGLVAGGVLLFRNRTDSRFRLSPSFPC